MYKNWNPKSSSTQVNYERQTSQDLMIVKSGAVSLPLAEHKAKNQQPAFDPEVTHHSLGCSAACQKKSFCFFNSPSSWVT